MDIDPYVPEVIPPNVDPPLPKYRRFFIEFFFHFFSSLNVPVQGFTFLFKDAVVHTFMYYYFFEMHNLPPLPRVLNLSIPSLTFPAGPLCRCCWRGPGGGRPAAKSRSGTSSPPSCPPSAGPSCPPTPCKREPPGDGSCLVRASFELRSPPWVVVGGGLVLDAPPSAYLGWGRGFNARISGKFRHPPPNSGRAQDSQPVSDLRCRALL